MMFLLRFLQVFFVLWLIPASAFPAHRLDIYHSGEPFNTERFFPTLGQPDLIRLKQEAIPAILKIFKDAEKNAGTRGEKNLIALAIGYLHLKQGDPKTALHYFKDRIIGNFILDDLRLHFESQSLRTLALDAFENKKYSLAINSLLQSIDGRMKIFQTFPDSPFHGEVSRFLAEDEKILGDVYLDTFNYMAAWQAYRKALMRDFPDNGQHRIQVTLALAKTYEAAGEWAEAADSYVLLLDQSDSPEMRQAAEEFFRKNEPRFREENIDLRPFYGAIQGTADHPGENATLEKEAPQPEYENPAVRDFYGLPAGSDLPAVLESGRRVLSQYPGIREAREVSLRIRNRMVSFLETHDWIGAMDPIADLLPARDLAKLGLALWKKNRPGQAAVFYKRIPARYPLEIDLCHQSLYFLGRIYEDLGDLSSALGYYHLLLEKYDYGPYTTAARFKIPWIERRQGEKDKARYHFERLISFYDSPAFEQWKNAYPSSDSFESAAYYWSARTESDLGREEGRVRRLDHLTRKLPFDFYSILSRLERNLDLKELVAGGDEPEPAHRTPGLGDIRRKRLSHAEKLIAIGFLEYAEKELEQITPGRESPEFQVYLARLFHRARGFQNSIRLHWSLLPKSEGAGLSASVAQELFPPAWLEPVEETSRRFGLDPWFILSLMRQESAFDAGIVSSAHAVGLMQLLPATAAAVARSVDTDPPEGDQLKEPLTNITLGVEYINHLMETFEGNPIYTLAAYNAGESKVKEWIGLRHDLGPVEFIESIPYNETRNYVKKILRNYAIYLTLYPKENVKGLKELLTKVRD